MQRIITAVLSLAIVASGAFGLWFATPVLAQNKSAVCQGIEATGGKCTTGNGSGISAIVQNIIDIFSWIVGVAAVIMVIYGGFQFITSAGDSAKAAKGRSTILFAIVGLIIVALAQLIVVFVLNEATTVSDTTTSLLYDPFV